MNGLSLCSGIAGLDLGLRIAEPEYRTVCHVEIERFPQDILLARMADGVLERAPIWDDLKRFDAQRWRGLVDVVHGGYPCQPFSVAGKRLGAADPRHLWPDVARIVRECEPEWCFFENVAGHLQLGYREVADELESLGYRVASGLFTAAEVGAPHRRQRLFILANAGSRVAREAPTSRADDARGTTSAGASGVGHVGNPDHTRLAERQLAEDEHGDLRGEGAPVVSAGLGAWPPGPEERGRWDAVLRVRPELAPAHVADASHGRARGAGSGCDTRRAAEGDATQSPVRGGAHGLPRRVDRLKALGNAAVPRVAALAWRTLRRELA